MLGYPDFTFAMPRTIAGLHDFLALALLVIIFTLVLMAITGWASNRVVGDHLDE